MDPERDVAHDALRFSVFNLLEGWAVEALVDPPIVLTASYLTLLVLFATYLRTSLGTTETRAASSSVQQRNDSGFSLIDIIVFIRMKRETPLASSM